MIRLLKISSSELRPLVEKSYENDKELFEKFHVGRFDLKTCVEKTIEMVEEVGQVKNLNYYRVDCDGIDIGYVVTFENVLYSFAIAMEYRKRDILIEWWNRVNEVLGNDFYAILYKNNTRAGDFLKKQNMVEHNVDEKLFIYCKN